MYMLLICLHTCTYQLLTSILQKDAMLEELQRKVESFEQDKDSCVMEVRMHVRMYMYIHTSVMVYSIRNLKHQWCGASLCNAQHKESWANWLWYAMAND